MNLIFMRHGESTDNVKEILSDREIYWSTLTESGIETTLESIKSLPETIDKIYVSPFPRTIETAHFVSEKYSKAAVIIEKRLHEINHGKYSGQKNNEDLDNTRKKQIAGDFFVRFGEYGENKYEIEERLCDFLKDVYKNNFSTNTIIIVSHGTITSYMKRILNIKTPHIKTGKTEEFVDVDFSPLFEYVKLLKNIKLEKIKERVNQIELLNINNNLKNNLIRMFKKEFNNIEFPDDYFLSFIDGISTKGLVQVDDAKFDNSTILVCFYNNFDGFVEKWMNHYISIGINNYVLIDNNSDDDSTNKLKNYSKKVNISFWKIKEKYNCYKMCGWKQQIFEFYGINRKYLTIDSDELFIYKNYNSLKFEDFLKESKALYIKSMMLDVYTNKKIYDGTLEDFKYVDKGTYKINSNVSYIQRFYGGPRSRIFGINPSLQKVPFITYTGKEIFANDHYYYPWYINKETIFCSYLLHYKFLPGDDKKYTTFVKDGRHWNDSHEYKIYNAELIKNNKITFYDKKISINIDDIDFSF